MPSPNGTYDRKTKTLLKLQLLPWGFVNIVASGGKTQFKVLHGLLVVFPWEHSFGYKPSKDVLTYSSLNFSARDFGDRQITRFGQIPCQYHVWKKLHLL